MSFSSNRLLLSLLATSLLAPLPARADDAPTTVSELTLVGRKNDYKPTVATTATKVDAPLRDIPQTIDVVALQVMQDQRALSLQDVLKNVPGVGFSHGDGQRDQVSIRGFTAIADQFIDGVRDDALYFRDLSNIERVEVIKGPASVLYGRGSSGGLINRVTRKPGFDLAAAAVSFGAWSDGRIEFDLGKVLPQYSAAVRVTGAVERADGYRDPQFLEREAVAPAVSLALGENTTLLLQADYLRDERVTDFGVPAYRGRPVAVDARTYYGAANARDVDTSESKVASGTATLTHRFGETLKFRNAFRYYDYSLSRFNTLPGSVNEAAQTVSLNRSNVERDEHGWFNQAELSQDLTLGATGHQILYGIEVGRQVKDALTFSRSGVATVSLFNPVLPFLPRTVPGAPTADNRTTFDTLGVYVQDLVSLGEYWKALVGVRYDRFEQETDQHLPGLADLARTDKNWSPRLGLVWQPTKNQSYYASWSRSFQPSGETFALAASNADIAPEETTNTEVGGKFDFLDGQASATVSVFRLERTNIKATDPATLKIIPIGVQRTDGIELTGHLDLADGWRALAGYAYLDAKVTDSIAVDAGRPIKGKRATITPEHSANIWLTKGVEGRYGFGVGANYVGDRFANPGNTVTLPAYVTVDAMVWKRFGPLVAQLNVGNLLDEGYIVSGHGTSPNLNLPGAPRSAMVTLRYALP
ncbi:TonB-dependent receptor [Phenylobacterium sp.]|uniref:TonB-dependent receptor n=1 Tax=Phenylobacterium sp. TaxID=1871053 RepID=UPI003BAC40A8